MDAQMGVPGQLMVLMVAAGVLAVWVDVRLGERGPRSLAKVALHGATGWAVVGLCGALAGMVVEPGSLPRTLVALLAIVLPGWIYAFLASLWTLRLVRDTVPR
jgi:ABC-type branched-subunit amino acid transport system permease subunit